MKTALLITVLAALPMLAQQPQGAPQAPQAPAPAQAPQAAQQHRHGHHMGMPGQRPQWQGKQTPQRPQWNKQRPQRPQMAKQHAQWANHPLVQAWQKMTPEQRKQTIQQVAAVVKQLHQRHQQMPQWGKKAPQRPQQAKRAPQRHHMSFGPQGRRHMVRGHQRPHFAAPRMGAPRHQMWGKKVQRPAWGKCAPCGKCQKCCKKQAPRRHHMSFGPQGRRHMVRGHQRPHFAAPRMGAPRHQAWGKKVQRPAWGKCAPCGKCQKCAKCQKCCKKQAPRRHHMSFGPQGRRHMVRGHQRPHFAAPRMGAPRHQMWGKKVQRPAWGKPCRHGRKAA